MRTLIRLITLLGLALALSPMTPGLAAAQDSPLGEAGIDYNYVHTNAPPGGCGCFSMHGGDAWIAYNMPRSFAIIAQVSSQHASNIGGSATDLTLTSYLFGPRYSLDLSRRFVPFAQVLLGVAHASGTFAPGSAGYPGSANAFGMTVGGGVDMKLSNRFAVRAFQADYYLTNFANGVNDHQNNLRISAGLIFRFGKK
jgi:outer membrane immunogenic protein